MKSMKKFASLALALALILSLSIPAFAAEEKGSITVDNAVVGQTYTLYRIFDLESYSTTNNAFAYKVNSAWSNFFAENADGLSYVNIDDQGYVTWKNDASAAEFAAKAIAYATKNNIASVTSQTVAETTDGATSTTIKFIALDLGYYLLDSTLGALCSLNTTKPDVTIKEKNTAPTIKKEVQEDSDQSWGDSNTAQIGDTVNFKITVAAKPGAQSYIVHDKMEEGLTFNAESVEIKGANVTDDYTVITADLKDECTFHIVFTQTYLDKITQDTDIVITYSAILNDKAVISTNTNDNAAKLSYGDESKTETEEDTTTTTTYQFELVKTDSNNKLLDGATFELYDAQNDGNKIALVKDGDAYRIATAAEKAAEGFVSAIIDVENGQITIKGEDADTTYWLEEVDAPAGYNKLAARVEVKMEKANLDATVAENVWTAGGVHVVNQAGSLLPETGGIGTTIFYAVGGILVAAAVVLLVTKKRMASN